MITQDAFGLLVHPLGMQLDDLAAQEPEDRLDVAGRRIFALEEAAAGL